MKREQLEQILLDVQKPAQYIGGELNSVMKDKSKVDCRLALSLIHILAEPGRMQTVVNPASLTLLIA